MTRHQLGRKLALFEAAYRVYNRSDTSSFIRIEPSSSITIKLLTIFLEYETSEALSKKHHKNDFMLV